MASVPSVDFRAKCRQGLLSLGESLLKDLEAASAVDVAQKVDCLAKVVALLDDLDARETPYEAAQRAIKDHLAEILAARLIP